ncbi:MAG TPA: endopeptidase La [Polyangiaceae bacterium]|nr:endopeptidase La [Polyangiaceae bacterium]
MFFKSDTPDAQRAPMPALPLRDIIVFPHMVSQLFVGREKSIAALDEAMNRDKEIFLVAQKNARTNEPTPEDIYEIGTIGTIVQLLRLADGTVKVLVEGRQRARVKRYSNTREFFLVEVEALPDSETGDVEVEALMRSVQSTFEIYVKLNKKVAAEVVLSVQSIETPSKLADTIAANLPTIKLSERHELLAMTDVKERLERLYQLMQAEIEILQVEKKIRTRVKKQMERTQKEYYLNEQMQAIQKELGGGERDEFKNELLEIEEALKKKALSEEARGKVEKELKKLKMMHPTSAEATVVRNYIDWIVGLPWGEASEETFDVQLAEDILNEDHFGLEKPKERIVEYLAVQALTGELKSPILCFVGPPGVGKTSIARSIARATGRKFVRLSLGGVRDEAEIRGHRRTYIGALPGKLIQSLKKVGTQNPVFLLDEIDKMSTDFRGDPASALLEVLDPEQNKSFNDHYLDLDYDLSDVMFITTANTLSGIPMPLRDRMEIIELSSYTEIEKLSIASNYLVPRAKKECGLEAVPVELKEEALRAVIQNYTREAGVRSLERQISALLRKVALGIVKKYGTPPATPPVLADAPVAEATFEEAKTTAGPAKRPARRLPEVTEPIVIGAEQVTELLGVAKYRPGKNEEPDLIGLTHGLSVSDYGGDTLDCEVSVVPGKGKLVITGLLEKGMEESAQAALSYIRSRAPGLGLTPEFYQSLDIHVHFPDFVRKDGPSAGVTMATSIASALTRIPVRHDVAMNGEITLRGRVMPIGGLKEKLLAAKRNGMRLVLVPRENQKDLAEVPEQVKSALQVVLVEHMDEVLRHALVLEDPSQFLRGPTATTSGLAQPVVEYREVVAPPPSDDDDEPSSPGQLPGAPGQLLGV